MSRSQLNAAFLLASYRTAIKQIIDVTMGAGIDDQKLDMGLVGVTADLVDAIAHLRASGNQARPADAGIGTSTMSSPIEGAAQPHPADDDSQTALAVSETASETSSPLTDVIIWRIASAFGVEQGGHTEMLEASASAIDEILGGAKEHETIADYIAYMSSELAAARQAVSDARIAMSRVASALEVSEPDQAGELVLEQAQKLSTLKVKLKRRVAECFKTGMPQLGDEIAHHLSGIMPSKEFGAWWKTLPNVGGEFKNAPDKPVYTAVVEANRRAQKEVAASLGVPLRGPTPTNPLAADGWPVRESTIHHQTDSDGSEATASRSQPSPVESGTRTDTPSVPGAIAVVWENKIRPMVGRALTGMRVTVSPQGSGHIAYAYEVSLWFGGTKITLLSTTIKVEE